MNIDSDIHHIITSLIQEIKKEPFLYLQEIDIQIELAARIKGLLGESNKVEIIHTELNKTGIIKTSRLLAEPYLKGNFHPDLVLLSQTQEGSDLSIGVFNADWICEIKYKNNLKEVDVDFGKLASMLSLSGTEETKATQIYLYLDPPVEDPLLIENNLRKRYPQIQERIKCYFERILIKAV